ncbi:AMP-dependent synthetase/ligase [Rhodovibrio salinarum]|uniref:Long-chain fatty acid--CoA ligase n=1 Tax=Rhodovibrio salinarum TaxID=1087 RepID=A0A934QKW9_9PROT|nr:long-chain fatty acid--CoA ligase [Rhodovibrio salinarum]MBK1698776.1 long-chain fatty acid--CoA ligase [Rhodovibrio salinarum]
MALATTARREAVGPDFAHDDYDRWESIPQAFFDVVARAPDAPQLWAKHDGRWQPLTRAEVAERVRALARGLHRLGLQPGERVVLVAENRPEFVIADLAIMTAGGITVPAYTTNTEADHLHVLEDSGAAFAVVSTKELAQRVLPAAARATHCRTAIQIEGELPTQQPAHLDVYPWSAAIQAPAGNGAFDPDTAAQALARDATACFIYTSGTGGAPKGVVLSHGNILSNCKMAYHLLTSFGLGDEVFLSFLPLSHSYEHTAGQCFPLTIGAQIYYSRGVEHLSTELQEVQPTVMTAVPRLYESFQQRILRGIEKAPAHRRKLFHKTVELGRKRYHDPGALTLVERLQNAVLDRLVRRQVAARFGGRLKGMVSGGAALDPEVGIFFHALGVRVLQGYGQTETSPVVACNPPGKCKLHTVGPPLPDVTVRIAEDGELLVHGPNVMQGYWELPEQTAATIKDGWLHTGDLGAIDEEGYVQITDRKKDIVVLSGGDTLSPARVEGFLTRQPEIAQAMVYGDRRPHLVAILVPDGEWLADWAKRHAKTGDKTGSGGADQLMANLAEDTDLRAELDRVVHRVNQEISQSEKVRRFVIAPAPFTVDNDMMTPTLKVRRHKVKERYQENLEALYGR